MPGRVQSESPWMAEVMRFAAVSSEGILFVARFARSGAMGTRRRLVAEATALTTCSFSSGSREQVE